MRWTRSINLVIAAIFLIGCQRAMHSNATNARAAAIQNPSPTTVRTRPLKLAFVTNNASTFWKTAARGVNRYEAQTGVRVEIKLPPNGRVEEQNQILTSLVDQGFDAIAVSVIAPRDQLPILQSLSKRTKLITFDSDAPDSGRLLFVGTHNFETGKLLGERIVKLLPSGGKIAVFVGSFRAENATQRLKGIRAAIDGHKIEIVEQLEDLLDRAKARANVIDALTAHPDIKLLCGLWSYNGPAMAYAIHESGKKGKVFAVCFDDEDETLAAIENGTIDATVVQLPFEFGYKSAQWLHRLASDFDHARTEIPKDQFINAGVELIDRSNLADYRKRLAEWVK